MRAIYFTLGITTLVIGTIGIVLPVLPTTPFLLLSLACFLKSSRKLYNFVLDNKYLGPYVKDYVSGEGIPLNMKKRAIALVWITISFSALVVIDVIHLKILLFTIAILVSSYIWTRKTKEA
ncbi:MAG: YbaN family protein [Clostridia bacterium]